MEEYISVIKMFGLNFPVRGWAMCNGQIMSIAQNTALFSLLGTTYGGNGQTTFALPNFQGRTPIHWGSGPGLSPYVLGQAAGTESVSILTSNLPAHTHTLTANTAAGTTGVPTNNYLSASPKNGSGPSAVSLNTYTTTAPNTNLGLLSVGATGSNIPVSILQPYLAVSFEICLEGIFPSRN
ncbi:Phage Tail Collar Domain protein [compost metagenome]|uniref:phage tail protein n=1 Tax=Pedobacter ghigonis TaxID=2730403 RepID=UPI000F9EED26|nr:tail fiber protein [Pedobacter ghigonis]